MSHTSYYYRLHTFLFAHVLHFNDTRIRCTLRCSLANGLELRAKQLEKLILNDDIILVQNSESVAMYIFSATTHNLKNTYSVHLQTILMEEKNKK